MRCHEAYQYHELIPPAVKTNPGVMKHGCDMRHRAFVRKQCCHGSRIAQKVHFLLFGTHSPCICSILHRLSIWLMSADQKRHVHETERFYFLRLWSGEIRFSSAMVLGYTPLLVATLASKIGFGNSSLIA